VAYQLAQMEITAHLDYAEAITCQIDVPISLLEPLRGAAFSPRIKMAEPSLKKAEFLPLVWLGVQFERDYTTSPSKMEPLDPFSETEPTRRHRDGYDVLPSQPRSNPRPPTENVGRDLPRYEPIQELGKGAHGRSLADAGHLPAPQGRQQTIAAPAQQSPKSRPSFLSEAPNHGTLGAPWRGCRFYTLEIDSEGRLSYAMKVVQGNTLKEEIGELKDAQLANPNRKTWQRELFRLLEIFLKVCDALDYAHSKGIIHRDLKPANIMIGPFREVYIVDWGIAQVWNRPGVENEEPSKVIAGTPRYLSPEQARCRPLKPASDQFTMGLILQEILTLAPAFKASSMPEMLKKILTGNRAPCDQALEMHPIPADLQAVVSKATALKADQRYASVADMAADLRRYLQDVETTVKPDNLQRRALRWIRRNPQRALLGSMLVLVACILAVAGSLYIWQQTQVQTQRRKAVLEDLQRKLTMTGQQLDIYLSGFEAQLEYLTGAAAESFQRGEALPGEMFTSQRLPQTSLLPSPEETAAGGPLYWHQLVWLNPAPAYSRLLSMLPIFQRVFAVSADPQGNSLDWLQSKEHASPLGWASIDFQDGPQLLYPGSPQASGVAARLNHPISALKPTGAPPPIRETRPVWLGPVQLGATPYFLVQAPIFNDQSKQLGLGSLCLRQPSLEKELKKAPLNEGLLSLLVSDAQGKILFSRDQNQNETWPEALLKDLKSGKSGIYESAEGLYVYQSLSTANWRLIARIDFQTLLSQKVAPR
jgi:serine/threonine protein kinase